MTPILVFTTLPDTPAAERIATALLEARLAACVNIGPPTVSLYHWRQAIEKSDEVPLVIKTSAECFPLLQARLAELHPYELPEIVAVPIIAGLPEYLGWIAAETRTPVTAAV